MIFTIILCKLFNKIFLNNQSKGDCFSVIFFIINKLKDEMEVKYYVPIIVGFPFFPSFHFSQVNVQRYLRSFCTKSVRYESIQLRRSSWKKKQTNLEHLEQKIKYEKLWNKRYYLSPAVILLLFCKWWLLSIKFMEALITYDVVAQQNMFSCRSLLEHVQWLTVIISKGTDHTQRIPENIWRHK